LLWEHPKKAKDIPQSKEIVLGDYSLGSCAERCERCWNAMWRRWRSMLRELWKDQGLQVLSARQAEGNNAAGAGSLKD
jgi:hypothetical protein